MVETELVIAIIGALTLLFAGTLTGVFKYMLANTKQTAKTESALVAFEKAFERHLSEGDKAQEKIATMVTEAIRGRQRLQEETRVAIAELNLKVEQLAEKREARA